MNAQPLNGVPATLYVKDFGAVGDGCHDDAASILAAVNALKRQAPGSALEFEANKTYYYKGNGTPIKAVFDFKHNNGLTVRGNNCLIKLGGYTGMYADIRFCENITLEGINFDFAEYKPAFHTEVESVDLENGTAVLIADRDINLTNGECFGGSQRLSCTPPTPYSHYFVWIAKLEMLDRAARRVRMYIRKNEAVKDDIVYSEYLDNTLQVLADETLRKYGLIVPMPYSGYYNEIMFEMRYNKDIVMRDVNIYSVPYHAFMITGCEGNFLFDNVNVVHAPYDKELEFCSWGDIFHVTNNRAKFVWKNCVQDYCFDDAFNINTSTLHVKKVHAADDITVGQLDTWYGVPHILPGDTLTVVDRKAGKLLGTPTVTEVEEHLPPARVKLSDQTELRIRLSEPLPDLREGRDIFVWDEDLVCDPASEMINCTMDGTFRVRSNMTFTNCKFHVRRFWIGVEAPVEGPIPHDVLFRGCEFTDDEGVIPGDEHMWLIRSYNAVNADGYRAKNIVFEDCKGIDYDRIRKDPYDEVIIR